MGAERKPLHVTQGKELIEMLKTLIREDGRHFIMEDVTPDGMRWIILSLDQRITDVEARLAAIEATSHK